jgi:hypothetical protein
MSETTGKLVAGGQIKHVQVIHQKLINILYVRIQ